MKPTADERAKIEDAGGSPERGYEEWKRAKIERALAETHDRAAMIPIERIVRDFGV